MQIDLPDPSTVDALLADWAGVSADFGVLLRRYGAPAPALRHFGLIHWGAGHLDVAAEALGAALALTPQEARLWADLAGVYDAMADAGRAEAAIRCSLDCDPAQARSWQVLASLAERRGAADEAEAAFGRALDVDPSYGDAHLGLGLLRFDQRRLDEALQSLNAAIAHGHATALGYSCLGHILYMLSDFGPCAAAFETAAGLAEPDHNSRRKYARARTFLTMIEGRTEEALADYPALAGDAAEDLADISRDAFSLLSAYGHMAAAADIGRRRLAADPHDPIQRYLLDAVTGKALTQAPADYVEDYFDRFAPEFDRKLVGVLRYRVPERLAALVARHRGGFEQVLDLGCGTGLAAEPLKALGGRRTGVDLSGRMLEEAGKRGAYAALVKAEAVAYLAGDTQGFDLVFAADLLIYLGDLGPLMRAAARVLRPGGLLAVSIETTAAGDFRLLPSGRFAHAPAYARRMAEDHFEIVETDGGMIRLEANRPVDGLLMLLRRR